MMKSSISMTKPFKVLLKMKTKSLKAKSTYSVILMYAVTSLFRNCFDSIDSDFTNRQTFIKFVLIRSELVENDNSVAYVGQF